MMTRSSLFPVGLLLVAGLAVSPAVPEAQAQERGQTLEVAPREPVVTVLEAGQEPRQPLRYEFRTGQKEQVRMTMTMDMQMQSGSMPIPAMPPMGFDFVFDVEVTRIEGDEVHASARFVSIELDLDENFFPPAVRAEIDGVMQPMLGVEMLSVMDDRGVARHVTYSSGEQLPPELQQMQGTIESGLTTLPLPQEPVGVGARWQIRESVEEQGFTLTQQTEVTLREVTDEGFVLGLSLTQQAPRQAVDAPDIPPGVSAEITMQGTGEGELRILRGRIAPISTMTASQESEVFMSGGGLNETMKTTLKTGARVGPVEPARP